MGKKKVKKGPAPLKRLVRFLEKGERLVIRGVRGKPVKKVISGRKYILEVRKGKKLTGYVNNLKRVKVKGKELRKPVPKEFTSSMVSRLSHTKKLKPGAGAKLGKAKIRLKSNRRVTSQITTRSKIISEIKKNSGKAFNLKISFDQDSNGNYMNEIRGEKIYFEDDGMTDEELKKMIVSNFLYQVGRVSRRFSDVKKASNDVKNKRRLIQEADVQLEFTELYMWKLIVVKGKAKGKEWEFSTKDEALQYLEKLQSENPRVYSERNVVLKKVYI